MVEVVIAGSPAEQSVDDLQRLDPERIHEIFFVDESGLDDHVAQALQSLLLDPQRFLELGLGDPTGAYQDRPEQVLDTVGLGVGADHAPLVELDGDGVLAVAQRQDAGLALDADQLEDVGETEVLDGSLKSQPQASPVRASARRCRGARRSPSQPTPGRRGLDLVQRRHRSCAQEVEAQVQTRQAAQWPQEDRCQAIKAASQASSSTVPNAALPRRICAAPGQDEGDEFAHPPSPRLVAFDLVEFPALRFVGQAVPEDVQVEALATVFLPLSAALAEMTERASAADTTPGHPVGMRDQADAHAGQQRQQSDDRDRVEELPREPTARASGDGVGPAALQGRFPDRGDPDRRVEDAGAVGLTPRDGQHLGQLLGVELGGRGPGMPRLS